MGGRGQFVRGGDVSAEGCVYGFDVGLEGGLEVIAGVIVPSHQLVHWDWCEWCLWVEGVIQLHITWEGEALGEVVVDVIGFALVFQR